jgi:hypothetical protein
MGGVMEEKQRTLDMVFDAIKVIVVVFVIVIPWLLGFMKLVDMLECK